MPPAMTERRDRVARKAEQLPEVRDRLVFVGRDGAVLYVGRAWRGHAGVPEEGTEFDAWLTGRRVEWIDLHARRPVEASLSLLAAAPRCVLRVPQRDSAHAPAHAPAIQAGEAFHWLEWTRLGVFGEEPGVAFLLADVGRAWTELTRAAQGDQVRRRLAERLLGSQKLESLGALAGRVAHDFNNLLTPIVGNVGLALLDLPSESPLRKRAMAIKNAADRATALTRQLLNYAGQELPSAEAVSLTNAVEEMQLLLEAFAQSNTKLVFDLQPDVPWIEVDRSHLGQLVMNLVMNASEALQPDGGTIELRTGAHHLGASELAACTIGADGPEGVYAYLEVRDPGPGISAGDRERIFEPLFSTRASSRGLGLTAVAEIVRGYGAALDLESEPGLGTRIRVYFPLPSATRDGDALGAREGPVERPSRGALSAALGADAGKGTLLLVDDDENARRFMAEVLGAAGYVVREVASGPAAMSLFERNEGRFDVVVLDYAMPLVTGAELFDAMKSIEPGVRAVMVSGYAPSEAAEQLERRGLRGFVRKPFEPEALIAAVDAAREAD